MKPFRGDPFVGDAGSGKLQPPSHMQWNSQRRRGRCDREVFRDASLPSLHRPSALSQLRCFPPRSRIFPTHLSHAHVRASPSLRSEFDGHARRRCWRCASRSIQSASRSGTNAILGYMAVLLSSASPADAETPDALPSAAD